MPTIILTNEDLKKALILLIGDKYNIDTIMNKKINTDGELEIFWKRKK